MKQVALLTGAAGFAGRHMAKHLAERGYHVVGLVQEEGPPLPYLQAC